jgi:4-alpha-glucanotransferase
VDPRLGIEDIVLAIHDASFPSRPDEDTGRGSPYSRGARDFLSWARTQGFNGVQFGPQGETSRSNPSPYDGGTFTKSILSMALWPLAHEPAWEGILDPKTLEAIVRDAPKGDRVAYAYAYEQHHRALAEMYGRLNRRGPLAARFAEWKRSQAWWLERDARYEALAKLHGTDDWRTWTASYAPDDDTFAFGQFIVHTQHAELLAWANEHGMRLYGDLQIGLAFSDRWGRDELFLKGYHMGAPPSRTNPDGQAWGYPVFDPRSDDALAFLRARVQKMLSEFHGIRVDHPHGLVCPWVYDRDVARGTRLFESPDRPDLASLAIARADQIDFSVARYADGWVRSLDDAQVAAYSRRLDAVMDSGTVICEVLSTCPYPLRRVLERHGLGRFRVTQKADPLDPADVYRTDRAEREDWVMLGNHDTPPIWLATRRWSHEKREAWARYLRGRGIEHEGIEQAMLVDLFACDAAHVSIFFADLLGYDEIYNRPGIVSGENWTLRVRRDYRDARGLDVPRALEAALQAKR